MKYLVYGTLFAVTLPVLRANPTLNEGFYNISQRLETTINNIGSVHAEQANRFVPAQIPWSIQDEREQLFWKSFLNYYDYLSATGVTRRHQLVYGLIKSNTLTSPSLRLKEIGSILKQEEKSNNKLTYSNYSNWKKHFSKMEIAFKELNELKPAQVSAFVPPLPLSQSIQQLKGLKIDLDQLTLKHNDSFITAAVKPAPVEARISTKAAKKFKPSLDSGVLMAALKNTDFQVIFALVGIFVAALYFFDRSKKYAFKGLDTSHIPPDLASEMMAEESTEVSDQTPIVTLEESISLPELPVLTDLHHELAMELIKAEEIFDQEVVDEEKLYEEALEVLNVKPSRTGVSIEEKCKTLLENNKYLLDVANLKIHSYARSPFDSRVNASEEAVTEALSHLIKGTIAIANASSQKASFMEWNCKEQSGRVSLEFTLHGIDCDSQFLYMNALMDGEGSAPAYFGRTERTLDSYLATVGVRSSNKKTTVSLGIDSRSISAMNN